MVFITAGMGGGTGTGAAPVVAQLAKEMGILTVAVVTKPFPFEGRRRMQVALKGIEELSHHCDSLITIPNEKLITVLGRNATMIQAFRAANDVLLGAVQGIADLIVRPGLINVDFADVRTVMSEMGLAMMGTGTGPRRRPRAGRGRSRRSRTRCSTTSTCPAPTASWSTSPPVRTSPWREFDEVGRTIEDFASEDATVVIGTVLDPDMQDEVRVTVVATGLNRARRAAQPARDRGDGHERREPMRAPIKLVRNATTGLPDFDAMARSGANAVGRACGRASRQHRRGNRRGRPPRRLPTWPTAATWTSRRSCAARRTEQCRLCRVSRGCGQARAAVSFGRPAPAGRPLSATCWSDLAQPWDASTARPWTLSALAEDSAGQRGILRGRCVQAPSVRTLACPMFERPVSHRRRCCRQRTLKNVIRATGVGLHSGEKVYLTLRPAAGRYRHRVPPRRSGSGGRDSRAAPNWSPRPRCAPA